MKFFSEELSVKKNIGNAPAFYPISLAAVGAFVNGKPNFPGYKRGNFVKRTNFSLDLKMALSFKVYWGIQIK